MSQPACWSLWGFRTSRRATSPRYPYGLERAEDLAGLAVAAVVWASAVVAGWQSVHKLLVGSPTSHVSAGIAAAAVGIVGNHLVVGYKLRVGRCIQSVTLISDARHSWLDALSSAGALGGLIAVAAGQPWGDPVAGLAVTVFICHVGYEVTTDIGHRLLDGVDPGVITTAEYTALGVAGIEHAHARARWTGRTLRIDIEGWVAPQLTVAAAAHRLGHQVIEAVHHAVAEARAVSFTPRPLTDSASPGQA